MTWFLQHWEAVLGGGGILAFLRFLPKTFRWLAVLVQCQWHREQGLAREAALEMEVKKLRETAKTALTSRTAEIPNGGRSFSASDTPPTIHPGTP